MNITAIFFDDVGGVLERLDAWARTSPTPVIEVHPEVSFAVLAGQPLQHSKKSWAGAMLRRRLLEGAAITVPIDLGPLWEATSVNDVLDATVTAWTTRRYASREARSFPDPPH